MICKFVRLHESAKMPTKAHPEDSGFDLSALHTYRLSPGETHAFMTGIAIELPPGYGAQIRPRSSVSRVGLLVHTGTIDNGYRGDIKVVITNLSDSEHFMVVANWRIAQLVIEQVPEVVMVEVDELGASDRGDSGFGSSGK